MATYQLNTKIIPEDHNVWLVYAGKNRRFFDFFYENKCIFATTPGFAPQTNIFENDDQIRQFVRLTNRVYDYVRGRDPNAPNRRLDAYPASIGDHRTKDGRAFNNQVGNIKRLFNDMNPGDLILSPAEGHFNPMLVGEVTEAWAPAQTIRVPKLENELVPYRKVKWIRADLSRRDFPLRAAKGLQNPHAISQFDRDLYYDIYRTVYRSFMTAETSKIDIQAPLYSGHDPLETYEGGFLVKYFVAAYVAKGEGRLEEFRNLTDKQAVQRFYNPDLVLHFHQNFNSPGVYTLVGAQMLLAAIVGIGVGISVDADSLDQIMTNFSVTDGPSGAVGDEANKAKEEVQHLIDGIGRDKFEREIKETYGKEAREKLGLSTNITKE